MALRTVLHEGADCLRKKSRPVTRFDAKLKLLAEDMLETMKGENGVGLAAPQIGILRRLFVMNLGEEGDQIIVNPRIVEREGAQREREGCLSLPGLYGVVERPERLKLVYQDLDGHERQLTAEGLAAICVCHENDHLDGVLFRDLVEGELQRIELENDDEEEEGAE